MTRETDGRGPSAREAVRRLLGARDPATLQPVHASATSPVRWRGVQRRRVVLVAPGARVIPTVLLTPDDRGPWPVAVAVHQHNDEYHLGKSEPVGMAGDPALAYGLGLALRGVATAIPDLAGFEERRGPFPADADFERFLAWQAVADGVSHAGRHLDDLAVVVSWLLTELAPVSARVGLVGHSLGGQLGFFALASDPRVTAAVLSCGVGTVESFVGGHILHNPAWYPPGLVPFGDAPAIARVVEDQRVLVTAGREDPLFPLWGVDAVVGAFAPGVADLVTFDGGHGFPPQIQDSALDWLQQHLTDQVHTT